MRAIITIKNAETFRIKTWWTVQFNLIMFFHWTITLQHSLTTSIVTSNLFLIYKENRNFLFNKPFYYTNMKM